MQAHLTRRGIFAVSMLTISAIAATSSHASADDAGLADAGDDGGAADAMPTDAAGEAAAPADASGIVADATTTDAMAAFDSGLPGYAQPDGAPPAYAGGDIFQRLCIDPPTNVNFDFATVASPYADMASCVAYAGSEGHATVHTCFCNSCFDLMQQCDALQGCREILKCELDSGCTDSTSCYLLPGAPCASVIDAWGTGSVATALTQYITACGSAATPACPPM